MSAISRFSFDLDAECNLVWAALEEPASIASLGVEPADFYDPALRSLYSEALRLYALGNTRPLLAIGEEFPKESHWFWTDVDLNGPSLLWMLWAKHGEGTTPDLVSDAKQVIDLARARAQ